MAKASKCSLQQVNCCDQEAILLNSTLRRLLRVDLRPDIHAISYVPQQVLQVSIPVVFARQANCTRIMRKINVEMTQMFLRQ